MTAPTGTSRPTKLPFTESHEIFRASARRFFETECAPMQRDWEREGCAPRVIWKRAGELGFLCPGVPEEYGGLGADFLYRFILVEEQARAGVIVPALSQHSDRVASLISAFGMNAQRKTLLPRMVSGDMLGVLAIAERNSAAALRTLETVAKRDGDGYVITGTKHFVMGGHGADLVIVAAQTEAGISLFVVELAKVAGVEKGPLIKKVGSAGLDCIDIRFETTRLPASSLLGGEEGRGAAQIKAHGKEERLLAAAASIAALDRAIDMTIAYVKDRRAFKQRILDFQNTRFKLAEAKTEATVLRIFLERCVRNFLNGTLSEADAAMLAYSAADRQFAIVDDCVQLHGGYGYILDFAIARMWVDGRLDKILGCTGDAVSAIVGEDADALRERA